MWRSSLERHVYPILGPRPIGSVQTKDVLAVLRPIWENTTETATRLLGRMERILDYAQAITGAKAKTRPAGGVIWSTSSPNPRWSPGWYIMQPCPIATSYQSIAASAPSMVWPHASRLPDRNRSLPPALGGSDPAFQDGDSAGDLPNTTDGSTSVVTASRSYSEGSSLEVRLNTLRQMPEHLLLVLHYPHNGPHRSHITDCQTIREQISPSRADARESQLGKTGT